MTLKELFKAIADAIRKQEKTQDTIKAEDFPTRIENLQSGDSEYNAIIDLSNFTDTQRYLYCYITKISSINLKSNVTSLYNFFSGCYSLNEIPFFNTDNITNMSNMFANCNMLPNVPLYNTKKVTDTSYMFSNCRRLKSIPIFSLDNAVDLNHMFNYCTDITKIEISNATKAVDMSYMFVNCNNLEEIDLSTFRTTALTNISYMFSNCKKLKKIDIRNFTFDNINTYKLAFNAVPTTCEIIVNQNGYNFMTAKFPEYTNLTLVSE